MIPVEQAVVFLFVVAALASVIMAMFPREVKQMADAVTDWTAARVRQVWGWVHHPKPKRNALDPAAGSEWPKTDVREHVEKFNRAAARVAVAANERQSRTMKQQNGNTGSVTRTQEHTALSWAVSPTGGVVRSAIPGGVREFGQTQPDRLEVRVMIPRTAHEAEREADRYGVVSVGMTLDEAEALALGLLEAVTTARVEQRLSGVDQSEPAL